jgi:hypothetical protein
MNPLHETGLTPGSSLDSLPGDVTVNADLMTDSSAPASLPTGSGSDSWMSLDFLDELDDDFELMDFLPAAILEQHNEMISALENFRVAFNKDTLDDQLVQHLQVPLVPRQYDTELLNILINVFMKHVSGILSSFKDFQINTYTTVEQILAMAAVGELFIMERASVQLSKLLFTDASRVIYTKVCSSLSQNEPSLKTPSHRPIITNTRPKPSRAFFKRSSSWTYSAFAHIISERLRLARRITVH